MKKKKKIIKALLIIEYNLFFIPEFVTALLKLNSKEYFFKHVFLIKKVNTRQNINFNMVKNFIFLKNNEKLKFAFKVLIRFLEKILNPKKHNLKEIFEKKSIKVTEINQRMSKYKRLIKSINPDLIVNSATPSSPAFILPKSKPSEPSPLIPADFPRFH